MRTCNGRVDPTCMLGLRGAVAREAQPTLALASHAGLRLAAGCWREAAGYRENLGGEVSAVW